MVRGLEKLALQQQEQHTEKSILIMLPPSTWRFTQKFDWVKKMLTEKIEKAPSGITGGQSELFLSGVMKKLDEVKKSNTHMPVAIYISETEEGVYNLRYNIKPAIIFNEKFSIMSLLKESDKPLASYLAVVLTGCYATIYIVRGETITLLARLANESEGINMDSNSKCHLANNSIKKKSILSGYVRSVDKVLEQFLTSQPLAIFVFGSHTMGNYFAEHSFWHFNVVELITSNYTTVTEEFITGHVSLWAKHFFKLPC